MKLYSLKMRASAASKHVSGSERIVEAAEVPRSTADLAERGMSHPRGPVDFLNVKIERLQEADILHLDALPVSTVKTKDSREGREAMGAFLRGLEIASPDKVLRVLDAARGMRGAVLLDADTLERLEPDHTRGVRATCMDRERETEEPPCKSKNHYAEALVLATKVAHAPHIIGELCISDDPDYVTGYVSSAAAGYRRITCVKEMGSEDGGRVFLYRGDRAGVRETIDYLERQPVIVSGLKPLNAEAPRPDKWKFLSESLDGLRSQGLYRTLRRMDSAQSAEVLCDGRKRIMLASNHYLDFSSDERVRKAAAFAAEAFGTGSGGSRLTTGNGAWHERLEKALAEFKACESALLFSTGYEANLGTIAALMDKDCVIFSDELNHASIIDGCRLSRARIVVYRHNDMEALAKTLRRTPFERGLIVSDAVFSMDGDILDLPTFVQLSEKHGLLSMVDEAHSTGVIGKNGYGIVEHFNGQARPDVLMGTLSKSLGVEGGFICGRELLIDYLRNKARPFIFSTSMTPATAASSMKALELLRTEPERVLALRDNVRFFCERLTDAGLPAHSETAIVPIAVGDEKRALRVAEELWKRGIVLSAIRYPTVRRGEARLRAALMSSHTKEQLAYAAKTIAAVLKAL
ncbi:MAG: 8-amino-7-oxononanoate synthase [Desulfovibrio sp.]|nr:8-amino-7-oxononanoate synthase [Desulfovibrio sp.]